MVEMGYILRESVCVVHCVTAQNDDILLRSGAPISVFIFKFYVIEFARVLSSFSMRDGRTFFFFLLKQSFSLLVAIGTTVFFFFFFDEVKLPMGVIYDCQWQ